MSCKIESGGHDLCLSCLSLAGLIECLADGGLGCGRVALIEHKMIQRIFLLSIDDLRFDALSCESDKTYLRRWGLDDVPHTPLLDRLAAQGLHLNQATSTAPYTPASHASVFTGLYPPQHGVRAFLKTQIPPNVPILSEILRDAGYKVALSIDFLHVMQLVGLTRGGDFTVSADDEALFKQLADWRDEKLFVFAHFVDVHPPYKESWCPPSPDYHTPLYEETELLAEVLGLPDRLQRAADGSVSRPDLIRLDNQIRVELERRRLVTAVQLPRYLQGVTLFDQGRLKKFYTALEALDLLRDSLLVVMSDHGQAQMLPHHMANQSIPEKFDHGETLVDDLIRVPLLVVSPGNLEPRKIAQATSLVDLLPTILDFAGLEAPHALPGRSLARFASDPQAQGSICYSEVWYHDRAKLSQYLRECAAAGRILPEGYDTFLFRRSVRTADYKYVEVGEPLSSQDYLADDEAFMVNAIRKAAGRLEQPEDLARLRGEIAAGKTRPQIVEELQRTNPDRQAFYNLRTDPFETVNLLLMDNVRQMVGLPPCVERLATPLREALRRISQDAPQPTHLRQDMESAEMDIILDRLHNLGYIE